ncbi:hypothetical protein BJY24_004404 [Nocardia transvalensis]|uniref:Uncharacterized protein n=1 Tax=Nocardia transvalensis TaxID=37333 RepID=A0A7W9PG66_9NOCA|nr:hypothetical protein [Nocardia transvalensis]MBB5915492.1 hypothetical protein [Nocardia transvalensis]
MLLGNDVTSVRDLRGPATDVRPDLRHIRIEVGPFSLDYQGCAAQIADISAELVSVGLVVTVDDDVRPDLPPLPCGALWD